MITKFVKSEDLNKEKHVRTEYMPSAEHQSSLLNQQEALTLHDQQTLTLHITNLKKKMYT